MGQLNPTKYPNASAVESALDKAGTAVQPSALDSKVDKVSGKGLSTNDFTTSEKQKLAGLENYDDTDVKAEIDYLANTASKNLLRIDSLNNSGRDGITVELQNGVISVNGTSTQSSAFDLNLVWIGGWIPMNGVETIPTVEIEGNFPINDVWCAYKDTSGNNHFGAFTSTVIPVTATLERLYIKIRPGITYDSKIKPMLRPAFIKDDTFVPYAPTNLELYEMIKALMPAAQSEGTEA